MNIWDFNVSNLDLDVFFTGIRLLSLVVGLSVFVALRGRVRPLVGLVGIILLVFLVWFGSNYPLLRLYGLQAPGDRLRNVAWCATVAAGNSPLTTGTMGQTTLEPFWALLVGTLCWGRPDKVQTLYPFLSGAILIGIGILSYFHFGRRNQESSTGGSVDLTLRGLFIAFFVVLVATAPLDFIGSYRGQWAKLFLLKPNHALGLFGFPLLFGVLSKPSPLRKLLAALGLGLLGWVFIIYWVFFVLSLAVYLLVNLVLFRRIWAREAMGIVLIVVLSGIIIAPYYSLIAENYPHAVSVARGSYADDPLRSHWGDTPPMESSLFTMVTFDQGLLFFLAIIGWVDWIRERSRKTLLWASLFVGAYLLWIVNAALYFTARAREPDEIYYFLIFLLSVAGGNGAYRVVRAVGEAWRGAATVPVMRPTGVAVLLALILVPLSTAYWWNPYVMDPHFRVGLEPLPPFVPEVSDWILRETKGSDVFVGAGEVVDWIPTLTGRPIVPARGRWKDRVRRALTGDPKEDPRVGGVELDYILFEPELAKVLAVEPKDIDGDPRFRKVFNLRHLSIYRILRPSTAM